MEKKGIEGKRSEEKIRVEEFVDIDNECIK